MDNDSLRQHSIALIRGGMAYEPYEDIVLEFSADQRGKVPDGGERSPWQILEHMRISLRDILEYSQNENGTYRERAWPEEYWPAEAEGPWERTIRAYKSDVKELEGLVLERDLFKPFPWAPEHTLLREALLACDHAAYHLGELVELKRRLG